VAVKIKLKRLGKIRAPYYRIVVADARTKRDGRAIEEIGKYHPKADPSFIEVNSERVQHWLSVGAQPTDPVRSILKITGDWQKFKGEPGAEGTLRVAEPKPDKKLRYDALVKESKDGSPATTPKGSRSPSKAGTAKAADTKTAKAADTKAADAKAADAKADDSKPAKADAKADAGAKTDSKPKAKPKAEKESADASAAAPEAAAAASAPEAAEPEPAKSGSGA
jgi:small subunit ribosomal protein S16